MTGELNLVEVPEPELLFGHGQAMAHPKDGLLLYGPLPGPLSGGRLRIGVVSTPVGKELYRKCVDRLARPIAPARADDPNHTLFPGFQAVFGVEWPSDPAVWIEIDHDELARAIRGQDRYQAIHKAVSLYSDAIAEHLRDDSEAHVDLWMAVVPEDVHKYCRPKSKVAKNEAERPEVLMNKAAATRLLRDPGLFEEDNRSAEIYLYELDFHNRKRLAVAS